MNLEARKISLIQEFLRINNENAITAVENFINKAKLEFPDKAPVPMSVENFNAEVDEAVKDEKSGRLKKATTLMEDIEKWQ